MDTDGPTALIWSLSAAGIILGPTHSQLARLGRHSPPLADTLLAITSSVGQLCKNVLPIFTADNLKDDRCSEPGAAAGLAAVFCSSALSKGARASPYARLTQPLGNLILAVGQMTACRPKQAQ
jgi:hypothetical protein